MYFFIVEILRSLKSATDCAPNWGKAWHTWALFNTAAMAHYAFRCNSIVEQYVVSAVSGYFHSIASAATSKGVDDSLQVSQSHFFVIRLLCVLHQRHACISSSISLSIKQCNL